MSKYAIDRFDRFGEEAFTVFDPDGRVIVRNVATLERAKAIIQNHREYFRTQGAGVRVWEEEA